MFVIHLEHAPDILRAEIAFYAQEIAPYFLYPQPLLKSANSYGIKLHLLTKLRLYYCIRMQQKLDIQ